MKGFPTGIYSGMQTGADLGGMRAGLILGFRPEVNLGGHMPLNFMTEKGPCPWFKGQFGAVETPYRHYTFRTRLNVKETDQTLIFGQTLTPGSKQTLDICRQLNKPYWVNPSRAMLMGEDWGRVNIAGNRESGNPGIEKWVTWLLVEAWGPISIELKWRTVLPTMNVPTQPLLSDTTHWSPE